MPSIYDVRPVDLDGSLDVNVRFPYKTGDEIGLCIFMGTADNAGAPDTPTTYLYRFARQRVIANDLQTGTLVCTFRGDEVETLDPTWTDTVVPWDDRLPTEATDADKIDWDWVERADKRLVPNGLGGIVRRSADLSNRLR
jgi:hypothetical protein